MTSTPNFLFEKIDFYEILNELKINYSFDKFKNLNFSISLFDEIDSLITQSFEYSLQNMYDLNFLKKPLSKQEKKMKSYYKIIYKDLYRRWQRKESNYLKSFIIKFLYSSYCHFSKNMTENMNNYFIKNNYSKSIMIYQKSQYFEPLISFVKEFKLIINWTSSYNSKFTKSDQQELQNLYKLFSSKQNIKSIYVEDSPF